MDAADRAQDAEARVQRAKVLLDLKRPKDALPVLAEALRLDPESARICCYLAFALRECGQRTQSLAALDDALRKDPNYEWAHRLRAHLHLDLGQARAAVEAARAAQRLSPDVWQAGYTVALALLEARDFVAAEAEAGRVLTLEANNTDVFELLGRIALAREQPLPAEQRFREALRLEPLNVSAHEGLANALMAQSRVDEAVKAFDAALSVDPTARRAQAGLYQGTSTMRGQMWSRRLVARVGPRAYRFFVERERQSFKVFFAVFCGRVFAPIVALVVLGMKWLAPEEPLVPALALTSLLSLVPLIAMRWGFGGRYLEVSATTADRLSRVMSFVLSPLVMVGLGFAGMVVFRDDWIIPMVVMLVGFVLTTRQVIRIVRGWYYSHLSRLYPAYLRRRAAWRRYLDETPGGARLRFAGRIARNPLTYIVIALPGAFLTEDTAQLIFVNVLWVAIVAGIYLLLRAATRWVRRRFAGPVQRSGR